VIDSSDILLGKILIVDDKKANVLLLERMLRNAGYTAVASTLDPQSVCELHRKNGYDLILLDLGMPKMDGFQVMEGLKEIEKGDYLPVLVVTAQRAHKLRALEYGARDFITQPFDLPEVLMRIRNMLEVRLLHKQAQELNKLKTSLVSVVSHEVGNGLLVMKLAASLLKDNASVEWRKKNSRFFDMIATNGDALNLAVKNLLNLGRLEAGKLAINFAPTDAAEIMRGVAKSMELLCENKRLRVSLELGDGPQMVMADEACLTLAVSNLMSNAIKYTPEKGSVGLGILAEPSRPGHCRIYVQDTGIGVAVKDRAKILGGNYRSESGKKMAAQGFGVGLSLTQQIIEAHDSGIDIDGGPGKGSRFSFVLRTSPRKS
jgi:signal transduction histidine kinase